MRVAPDEVSLAYAEAWGDVYQASNGRPPFEKDPLWWKKRDDEVDHILSAPDPTEHARIRRVLHHCFTPRAVISQEPILQRYVGLLIKRLREQIPKNDSSAVIDIVPWLNYTTFDIIGDLSYGESFYCLEGQKLHSWIEAIFESLRAYCLFVAARFYPLIESTLMKCLPVWVHDAQKEHDRFVAERVNRRLGWEVQRPDLMSEIMRHINKGEMSVAEINANFDKLMIAGSETSATVLTGLVNLLIRNPKVLAKLVEEIRGAFGSESAINPEGLSGLPYLNAVLNEGMRLCPPVPIILPRRAPEGGAHVGGFWIPGKVSLLTFLQFLHLVNLRIEVLMFL